MSARNTETPAKQPRGARLGRTDARLESATTAIDRLRRFVRIDQVALEVRGLLRRVEELRVRLALAVVVLAA